jgi:serine/threonine-protein kinase HipA
MSESRCPLTYDLLSPDEDRYSRKGLRRLAPKLSSLAALPFTSQELRFEATARSGKMAIGGVQPKVNAILKPAAGQFEVVTTGGRYILKPDSPHYPEVPANEDVTMRMAAAAGLDVPLHGLLWTRADELCYVIRRFDRAGHSTKLAVEDFTQLLGLDRRTKYESSLEQVATVVERHCTFPVLEKVVLFRMVLVAFLAGNEDLHLKNFSLITDAKGTVMLSPIYDMLNSTIVLRDPRGETAIPLAGKKSRFRREHFRDYFGLERLALNRATVDLVLRQLHEAQPEWDRLLNQSFLSGEKQEAFRVLLADRRQRLWA